MLINVTKTRLGVTNSQVLHCIVSLLAMLLTGIRHDTQNNCMIKINGLITKSTREHASSHPLCLNATQTPKTETGRDSLVLTIIQIAFPYTDHGISSVEVRVYDFK